MNRGIRSLLLWVALATLAASACDCEAGRELSSGTGRLRAEPLAIDFGELQIGVEDVRTVQLENVGAFALEIGDMSISGSNAFAVVQTGDQVLAPGEKTTAAIGFQPAELGRVTATLQISSDGDPDLVTIELSGTGTERPPPPVNCTIAVTPAAIDFGSIPVGGSQEETATVMNTSGASCVIDRFEITGVSAAQFAISSATAGTLAAGASTQVTLRFTRADPSAISAELDVISTDVASPLRRVLLIGSAIGAGLCVMPTAVRFSSIAGSATQDVTLTACGAFDVDITALEFSLASSEISLQAPPAVPFTIARGMSRTVTVRYAPVDQTDDHAILRIRSNDALAPAVDVDITGSPEIVPEQVGRFLYYWQVDDQQQSDIVRLALQGGATPAPYWGQRTGQTGCPGCHHISPDGRYVAVVDFGLFLQSLYVVDTQNNQRVNLPIQVRAGASFAWRPDVNATPRYQYAVGANGIIHTGSLDGGYIGELAGANDVNFENGMPAWGPNGEIAFVRGQADFLHPGFGFTGAADLMVVPQTGGTAVPVPGASGNGMSNYYPAYSPNGLWISYTQSASGGTYAAADARVRLVRADRSGTVLQLPMINGNNGATSFPTWSIDGTYLSISSNRAGGLGDWDIYIAQIDPVTGAESAPTNLTAANTPGFEHAAQWSP